jgi:hypothetical protein
LVAFGPPRTLAENLTHGVKVEIEFDLQDTGITLLEIQTLLQIESTVDADNTLTFWLVDNEAIPDLVNILVTNGLRIRRVNPLTPTLEDVYFALHYAKSAGGEARSQV